MNMIDAFSKVEVFDEIGEVAVKELMAWASLLTFKGSEVIYRDEDWVENLYFLVDGWASISKFSSSGEKKVIFVFGRGKSLNEELINGLPASSTCECIENCIVLAIPRDRIQKMGIRRC